MEEKVLSLLVALIVILMILGVLGAAFNETPLGRGAMNTWNYVTQKVDDATRYETRKNVEDTCRAMIASYKADRLTYEQYRDAQSEEQRSWANQAMMRANQTAASYNDYMLKNSFVWLRNVPEDIKTELEFLKP